MTRKVIFTLSPFVVVILLAFALTLTSYRVEGQDIQYHLDHEYATIWINQDGTIDLLYDIKITCDRGTINYVNVGQPNGDFTIGQARDENNHTLPTADASEEDNYRARVYLYTPISTGQSVRFTLLTNVGHMIWEDDQNPDDVGMQFVPVWWDANVNEIRVSVVLPVGANQSNIGCTPDWDSAYNDPEEDNRLVVYWERHNLQPNQKFTTGLSFPKECVQRFYIRGYIIVPDDYPTIQEAVDYSSDGDTIYVRSGTYYGPVVINKTVHVVGENRETTILDGSGTNIGFYSVASNTSISGFQIRHATNGIILGSTGNNLTGNIVKDNTYGIEIGYPGHAIYACNTLRNNTLMNNQYNFVISSEGPYLSLFINDIDTSNTINGKTIYYLINKQNLILDPSSHPRVGYLGLVNCSGIIVRGLNLTENGQGMLLAFTTNSTITETNFRGNMWGGISLKYSCNNTFMDNYVENNKKGILLAASNGNRFVNNIVRDNDEGISSVPEVLVCTDNVFTGNLIVENQLNSMQLKGARGHQIVNNTIANNGGGLYLDAGTSHMFGGNVVADNRIRNNTHYGIFLESDSNTITQNTVQDNDCGIYFWIEPTNNTIYHNNFINNTNQLFALYPETWAIMKNNTWDDGFTSGGNYWSDHAGEDAYSGPYQNETCRDGIVDAAYGINETILDRYPLVNPWSTNLNPPVPRFRFSPDLPQAREEIAFDASSSYDLDEDIVSYCWDFDDGNISWTADSAIGHIYGFPGFYDVTLTAVDSGGLNCTYSQMVFVRMITSISISTSSKPTFIGFAVNVTGSLRDIYGTGLKNETVVLSYTFSGVSTWTPITSDTTDLLGDYDAVWIPPATGSFLLKAEWAGNSTFAGTHNVTHLDTLSYADQYVFSVESNSTVSSLAFNPSNLKLSFTVSGIPGTKGYVRATVAKSLVDDIQDVKVYLNNTRINYAASSLDDSWLLRFTYLHSTHEVAISLGEVMAPFAYTPLAIAIIFAVVSITVAVLLVTYFGGRRKQTPAKKHLS